MPSGAGKTEIPDHKGRAVMSLIPAWAPNLHPLLVHFPITLLIGAVTVDLASLLMPARPALRDTATLFYCAGAFMAMAAYFSGLSAAQGTPVSPEERAAVTAHFTWADRTTWFFVFFASFRIAFSYIWRPAARWAAVAAFVVALVGVGSLLLTADHGGRLVFQHGLGVATVPSSGGQLWTMPDHLPVATEIAVPRQGT
ncbi:MAG: hypothetical protein IIA55_13695 [Gemmatimonadetes bacterium]|nr:hypothetical protein [Gemmatimonadota bacterium]